MPDRAGIQYNGPVLEESHPRPRGKVSHLPEPPIHLVIGTPCYGGLLTVPHFTSALRLRDHCAKNGIRLTFALPWGDALVARARQDIAAHFLEDPTATHLLFIDADISYGVDQVLRLLHFNRDVCAGLYPLKRYDWEKIKKKAREDGDRLEEAGLSYVIGLKDQYETTDGFARVEEAGTGFLLIRRRVFEAMAEKYPELKYQSEDSQGPKNRTAFFNCLVDQNGVYLSEDYSFCKRWVGMGGEIWADLRSRLSHMGPEVFQGDLSRRFPLPPPQERP